MVEKVIVRSGGLSGAIMVIAHQSACGQLPLVGMALNELNSPLISRAAAMKSIIQHLLGGIIASHPPFIG
jgi:hypothetical protein